MLLSRIRCLRVPVRTMVVQNINNVFPCTSHNSLTRLDSKSISTVLSKSYKLLQTKTQYTADRTSSQNVNDEVIEESEDSIQEQEFESDSLRNLLYPDSKDSLIVSLNGCSSVQDVFAIIAADIQQFSAKHISQAVLVLWDLQKVYFRHSISEDVERTAAPLDLLRNYIEEINVHKDFIALINLIDGNYDTFSYDALSCTLLYLNKMGIDMKHHVLQKLIGKCEELIIQDGENFPLTALSRFTVAVHSQRGLWSYFVLSNALPLVLVRLEKCKSCEDFRLITICLNNMHHLVSEETLNLYKVKANELIESGEIGPDSCKTILKAVNLLNYPHWSQKNTVAIRRLCKQLQGCVKQLEVRELIALHKVFQSQLEPAGLLPEIQEYAKNLLALGEDSINKFGRSTTPQDLLSCVVPFSSPTQRKSFEDLTSKHVESSYPTSMPALFKILRHLKTSNVELCDSFWRRTLDNLEANPNEREDYKLFRVCYRYMHFNNNLGGTYRHYEFERRMVSWLVELFNGVSYFQPSKVARIAAFVIAYGHSQSSSRHDEVIPKELMKKLADMAPQFSVMDCLIISRGFQIAMELRYRTNISPALAQQFVNIDSLLNNCSRRQLHKNCTLLNVNMMMRAYTNRKGAKDSPLFHELVNHYNTISNPELSSRLLRDVTFNLVLARCLVPNILDALAEYVTQNADHIMGDTAEKVLYSCFLLGYSPNIKEFLNAAAQVIYRDRDRMTGLCFLHAALALSFLQCLPMEIIHFVFNVNFLDRLDEEIKHCYSKATYPVRVRSHLMQLNRAVCLDHPESMVPWFHTQYCKENEALAIKESSSFFDNVYSVLTKVVGKKSLIFCNKFVPYGYKVDFLVNIDIKGYPVLRLKRHEPGRRVAILLMTDDAYCENRPDHMRGFQQLKKRHLEMLRFNVLVIPLKFWNCMYMAEPLAKHNYLLQELNVKQQ